MSRLILTALKQGPHLLLLVLAALLLFAVVGARARQEASDAPQAPAVLPHLASEPRHFYVTSANARGDEALNSCTDGYHMASLWEILDPTTLTYANIPVAKTQSDQGSGPVSGWYGWIRTGADNSTTNQAGTANCAVWTSSDAASYGTIVQLSATWTAAATAISPWHAQTWSCSGIAPVWCVSDPVYGTWLPAIAN